MRKINSLFLSAFCGLPCLMSYTFKMIMRLNTFAEREVSSVHLSAILLHFNSLIMQKILSTHLHVDMQEQVLREKK